MSERLLPICLLLCLVSFKFGAGQLHCWRCDPCPDPHDNSSALLTAATCTSSQTACVKNTLRVLNGPAQISKGCVSSCTSSSSNYFSQGDFVNCCNTNYCNNSRRNPISFLLVVLCVFLFYSQ